MIAIIGGGISGLAAAYELAVREVPFVLLEAAPRLGGLIFTEHVDGYTIDAGADSLLAQKRTALEFCTELGLSKHLIATRPPRQAFVLHRGRLYPLPSPSVFGLPLTRWGLLRFRLLSPLGRLRVAMEPLVPRDVIAEQSIGAFFRRHFGRQVAQRVAQPLLGGIHAGDIDKLSLHTLAPRLAAVEGRGSVLRWLRRTAVVDPEGAFRSFPAGMGVLVNTIEQRLPAEAIRVNCAVSAIARAQQGWWLETTNGPIECEGIIIAAPAHAAARMLAGVDRDIAALCAQTAYASTATVALGWPRDAIRHALNGSGYVVVRSSNTVRITACTWVSSKFEGRAPHGRALLRAYLGGIHDPGAVDLSDEELIDTAVRDLSKTLGITKPPELARVYRWRNAGAQHDIGQANRATTIARRLSTYRGLFVTGSGFRVTGVPDCIGDGRRTAMAALGQV